MRIYFGTAREIEMGRRRPAAPLKQIKESTRCSAFLRPLELVDVGGFYFIVAQNQTDLTGLMPRKRTTPPQPYGQGKKLKAFRCTEKTSRLLKKAAKKRKISEAAYIEAALEDRFRKGGSLAAKGLGETYPTRPRDLNAYESRDQKPAEANCGSLQTASAGKMRRNKPHRSV